MSREDPLARFARKAARRVLASESLPAKLLVYNLSPSWRSSRLRSLLIAGLRPGAEDLHELAHLLLALAEDGAADKARELWAKLAGLQLENGLWISYDVDALEDYYRWLNDRGLALRITLDILEACARLGLKDPRLERARLAVVRMQEAEGCWRRTFVREAAWDVEVTARAVRVLGDELPEDKLERALMLIERWLKESLASGLARQLWALPEVLLTLKSTERLDAEDARRAALLMASRQRVDGDLGIRERNPWLTARALRLLSEVSPEVREAASEEVARIERIKLRLAELLEDESLVEEALDYIKLSAPRPSRPGVAGRLLAALRWALEEGSHEESPEPALKLFKRYLEEHTPGTVAEHAETLGEFVIRNAASCSPGYKELGLLLKLLKTGEAAASPLRALWLALRLLPGSNSLVADCYIFAIALIYDAFDDVGDYLSEVPCPTTRDLIFILRRLRLLSVPAVLRRYGMIREECISLSRELAPNAPWKLCVLSLIARRWCKGATRCSRLTVSGLERCPLYGACPHAPESAEVA